MPSTTAYIKSVGSQSANFNTGPYLGGVVKFVANRSSASSASVTVTAYHYIGFGSYANTTSYTSLPLAIRAWYGASSYGSRTSGASKTLNASGSTYKCTSGTASYFSAHSSDSNIDTKTKPTHKEGTIGS